MNNRSVILFILASLIIAPITGLIIPVSQYLYPLAIAFRVPTDGPPFSETILPLLGIISFLIGVISFIVFLASKKQRVGGLVFYCQFMFTYSVLALCIWLVFFGSRFIGNFPIKEFGFYLQWALLSIPHIVWLVFLRLVLKVLRNKNSWPNPSFKRDA